MEQPPNAPKLNPPQLEAVRHIGSPLLVLAGAGSGKTRVITHKIEYLIKRRGVAADTIAAITFTNKAAREMRRRVSDLLGFGGKRGPQISTFHTLGLRIIRDERDAIGYRGNVSIYSDSETEAALAEIARREFGTSDIDLWRIRQQISNWKSDLLLPEQVERVAVADRFGKVIARCYTRYAETLKARGAFDFDDLILVPTLLFRNNAEVLERWQHKLRYIMIDEYQDTNGAQYELARQLAQGHGDLTAVGDDDQSIYTWRGARPENLVRLREDFPALKVVKLEQNYRSTATILKAANQLIANNPHVFEKALWSQLGFGDPLRIMVCSDELDEAARVADSITHQFLLHRKPYHAFAILYRGNHQARVFEQALRERRIPYRISGGPSFFDFAEIKDLMAYLRLLVNPDDDNAFMRIVNTPRRSIGGQTVEKMIQTAAAKELSLMEIARDPSQGEDLGRAAAKLEEFAAWIDGLVRDIDPADPVATARKLVLEIDYEEWLRNSSEDETAAAGRLQNVNDLLDWMTRIHRDDRSATFEQIVNQLVISDIAERNSDEEELNCVALMTLHAAKGLEFPHVFIVGMEDNLLPHRSSLDTGDLTEERRLAYVGITRARETLTFTMARTRRRHGKNLTCEPSCFLKELPQDDLRWEGDTDRNSRTPETGRKTLASLKSLLQ